jgi:hypothetical protein
MVSPLATSIASGGDIVDPDAGSTFLAGSTRSLAGDIRGRGGYIIAPGSVTPDGSWVADPDTRGPYYVLDDAGGVMSPPEWARQAVSLYDARWADRIIGEANNGGDLIEQTIRSVDPNVAYSKVHASKGKYVRAEPISALYEQGRVHHVGRFDKLEDQMCSFCVDFDRKSMGYSPDRMDSLVWALTELSENSAPPKHSFIGLDMTGDGGGMPFSGLPMGGGNSAPPSWYGARYPG